MDSKCTAHSCVVFKSKPNSEIIITINTRPSIEARCPLPTKHKPNYKEACQIIKRLPIPQLLQGKTHPTFGYESFSAKKLHKNWQELLTLFYP